MRANVHGQKVYCGVLSCDNIKLANTTFNLARASNDISSEIEAVFRQIMKTNMENREYYL